MLSLRNLSIIGDLREWVHVRLHACCWHELVLERLWRGLLGLARYITRDNKLDFFSLFLSTRTQYVPWAQFSNRLHRHRRWRPTTMCSDISRSCMRAITLRCLEVLRARAPPALHRSRTASRMARLGIRWPAACRITTTSGSAVMKSRSRSHAVNFRRLTSSRSIGPTISCRWWSS